MKRKVIFATSLILLIGVAFFSYHQFRQAMAQEIVFRSLDILAKEDLFESDSEISEMQYLGSNLYEVKNENDDVFIIKLTMHRRVHRVEVFEYKTMMASFY